MNYSTYLSPSHHNVQKTKQDTLSSSELFYSGIVKTEKEKNEDEEESLDLRGTTCKIHINLEKSLDFCVWSIMFCVLSLYQSH